MTPNSDVVPTWSLIKAAVYGLLFTLVMFGGLALKTFTDPQFDPTDVRSWVICLGYLLAAPILFVTIAAFRNRFWAKMMLRPAFSTAEI
jgi:hypothetical protein